MPCRLNRRRLISTRLMLESFQHEASFFVTLTFDEEHCPDELSVRDGQLFLKRLRRRLPPKTLRYYLVGEYGERTWRPHYHAALFGLREPDLVGAAWPFGHVHVGFVTPQSTAYLAGYVTKKMTSKDDFRLGGRHPEFARMSLKPGIGAGAVQALADGAREALPSVIRMEGKLFPLGRYLKRKITEVYGQCTSERDRQLEYLLSEHRWSELARSLDEQDRAYKEALAIQRSKRSSLRRDREAL